MYKRFGLGTSTETKRFQGKKSTIYDPDINEEDNPLNKTYIILPRSVETNGHLLIYEYDERTHKLTRITAEIDKEPFRYKDTLFKGADQRKKECEKRIEQKVRAEHEKEADELKDKEADEFKDKEANELKDKEADGLKDKEADELKDKEADEFKDKEAFVTSSTKRKRQEMEEAEEKECHENMLNDVKDVTKQNDLGGFGSIFKKRSVGKGPVFGDKPIFQTYL